MQDYRERLVRLSDGSVCESDVYGIVERIREYDPNLTVKYCDPHRAELWDAPYAIFERCPDGIERLVFSVLTLDASVLERLTAADNQRQNVLLSLENHNLIVKQDQKRRYEEKMMANHDLLASAIRNPKGTYSFTVENEKTNSTKKVTVSDSGPPKIEYKGA